MSQVCLDALHNILKHIPEENLESVTIEIEECGGIDKPKSRLFLFSYRSLIKLIGLDKIENLQIHSNCEIYQQAYDILETYFSNENVSQLK